MPGGYPWSQGDLLLANDLNAAIANSGHGYGASNVKDFGAVGDGVADDTSAFIAAIAAGGTVDIPDGKYKLSGGPIVLPGGTCLRGVGPSRSILVPASNFQGFQNTLLHTLTAFTTIPTTPAVQTDVGFIIADLGVDCIVFTGSIFAFLFARNILFQNVWTDNHLPPSSPTYTAIQLIGCDNCTIDNTIMRNVSSSINGWKGTTRVKISNHHAIAGLAADTGVVALNGQATIVSDQEFSSNFEVTNTAIELASNAVALYFDSLHGGSSVRDVLINNVHILASGGTGNIALLARGRGSRIKTHNLTIEALPGAAFTTPIEVAGLFDNFAPYTATGIVTTTNGSNIVTVSTPNGVSSGPGNYIRIQSVAGGNLVGNGLTLNGYYLITGVSGPSDQFQAGTAVTAQVPASATASGPIAQSTTVVGYLGSFTDCEFNGITFDGVVAAGNPLLTISGGGHVFSNIAHTLNYNGAASPQYRAVIALDQTGDIGTVGVARAISVSNLSAAAGAGPFYPGYFGDLLVMFSAGTPYPNIMATVQSAAAAQALPLAGGQLSGGLSFNTAAASATDLSEHIMLLNGFGINLFNSNVNYVSEAAHAWFIGNTQMAYLDGNGFNNVVIGAVTPQPGTFTSVRTDGPGGPLWGGGVGAPGFAAPVGSLYSRTDGGVGSTLYVSRGGGTWAAVAGV